jgi:hypothetical protein
MNYGRTKYRIEVADDGKVIGRSFNWDDDKTDWVASENIRPYPGLSTDMLQFFTKVDWLPEAHINLLKEKERYQITISKEQPGCDASETASSLKNLDTGKFEIVAFTTQDCGKFLLVKTGYEESRILDQVFDLVETLEMYKKD